MVWNRKQSCEARAEAIFDKNKICLSQTVLSPLLVTEICSIWIVVWCVSAAFICHHNSFLIYGSLEKPTMANWSRVTHASVGSAVLFSAAFAVAGYITFTGYTQGIWAGPRTMNVLSLFYTRHLFYHLVFPLFRRHIWELLQRWWSGNFRSFLFWLQHHRHISTGVFCYPRGEWYFMCLMFMRPKWWQILKSCNKINGWYLTFNSR